MPSLDFLSAPQTWIAFATLFGLEVVLGIDNIIFISILSGKLPEQDRARARTTGLALALVTRILLLLSLSWVMGLTHPLFTIPILDTLIQPATEGAHGAATAAGGHGAVVGTPGGISGRDLILLIGGIFLLFKSVHEIHHKLEGEEGSAHKEGPKVSFAAIIAQILVLDVVFSLDSVITAVGMVDNVAIMIMAVIAAVCVMLFAAGPISNFVEKHPTLKILALSFLLLIGVTLIAEGLQIHIPKGFIYFAMAFSFGVEMLNLKMRKNHEPPVSLREP